MDGGLQGYQSMAFRVWATELSIFFNQQIMLQVLRYNYKTFFLDFSEPLYNFQSPVGCQLPNIPTIVNTPPHRNILRPNTQRFLLKICGNCCQFPNKRKHLLLTVIKRFGSNHNKCHANDKYSSYRVIATCFLHFDNKIH